MAERMDKSVDGIDLKDHAFPNFHSISPAISQLPLFSQLVIAPTAGVSAGS